MSDRSLFVTELDGGVEPPWTLARGVRPALWSVRRARISEVNRQSRRIFAGRNHVVSPLPFKPQVAA